MLFDFFYSKLKDAELVKKIVSNNDIKAFKVLYNRYKVYLANYIKSLHYDFEDDDIFDIVQESFIIVYEKLSTLRKYNSFKSWLFKIGLNKANEYYNKKSKYERIDYENNNFFSLDNTLEKTQNFKDVILKFNKSINNNIEKSIFYLRFFEKMKQKEIADFLGVSLRVVKYRSEIVINKFKRFLKKQKID